MTQFYLLRYRRVRDDNMGKGAFTSDETTSTVHEHYCYDYIDYERSQPCSSDIDVPQAAKLCPKTAPLVKTSSYFKLWYSDLSMGTIACKNSSSNLIGYFWT